MNDLRELIRNARKLQKITDEAVKRTLDELESICKNNKYDYKSAEEAVLLFIYEETDANDNKITLNDLMKNIRAISKG